MTNPHGNIPGTYAFYCTERDSAIGNALAAATRCTTDPAFNIGSMAFEVFCGEANALGYAREGHVVALDAIDSSVDTTFGELAARYDAFAGAYPYLGMGHACGPFTCLAGTAMDLVAFDVA